MVSLVPHPPPAAEGAIDRAGHTDGEPPEPAAQRAPVVGLDNQMQMVILNAEVQNPKASVGGDGKRAADGGEDPRRTQAPDWEVLRRVTCTGCVGTCTGLVRCGTPGRRSAVRFRPAPARRPPHVRGCGSESCKVRAILKRR